MGITTSQSRRQWEPIARLSGPSFNTILWASAVSSVLLALGCWMWLRATEAARSRESAVVDLVQPSIVTVRGGGEQTNVWRSRGLIVARNQVVFPRIGDALDPVTIEFQTDGRRVAAEVVGESFIDSGRGLVLSGVDLDDGVSTLSTTKGQNPQIDDMLLLVTPTRSRGMGAHRWRVTSVESENEIDEKFQLRRHHGTLPAFEAIGCPIVDRKGRLVGLAEAALEEDLLMCVPVSSVRAAQQESTARRQRSGQDLAAIEPNASAPPPANEGGPDAARESTPPAPAANPTMSAGAAARPTTPPAATGTPSEPSRAPQAPDQEGDVVSLPDGQADLPSVKAAKIKMPAPTVPNRPGGKPTEIEPTKPETATSVDELFIGLGKIARQAESQILPLPELSESDARRFGNDIREQLKAEHRPCSDQVLNARMRRLIDELLVADEQRPEDFTVTVLEDDEVNAFAFVGRNIVVNTGFVKFAGGDTEMEQFALAHEIGHIVLGHTDMPFRRALLTEQIFPGSAPGTLVLVGILKQTAYTQSDEADADCYSVGILKKIGRSSQGGIRFFERMRQRREAGSQDDSVANVLFRSHPSDSSRIRRIENDCQ